ncbi:hypothetical protein MPLB_2300053 [Mesorhizobium sp. ORS 3324]|nr:hypothetical protein MPLB_2300053 [Mesorhizobium sp. ORS 3324]
MLFPRNFGRNWLRGIALGVVWCLEIECKVAMPGDGCCGDHIGDLPVGKRTTRHYTADGSHCLGCRDRPIRASAGFNILVDSACQASCRQIDHNHGHLLARYPRAQNSEQPPGRLLNLLGLARGSWRRLWAVVAPRLLDVEVTKYFAGNIG